MKKYQHKETNEYYEMTKLSNYNGQLSYTFTPFKKGLSEITLTTDWVIDTDKFPRGITPIEKFREAETANEAVMKKEIEKIFKEVNLFPVITAHEKPKLIKVELEIRCPLCGSLLEWDGGALLSSPLQYNHKCPQCGYSETLFWHQNEVVMAKSAEDANRIITSGSWEEKRKLIESKQYDSKS